MLESILWWAVLALVGLPLTGRRAIFPASFPDRGYAFASRSVDRFAYASLGLLTSAGIPHRISLSMGLAGSPGSRSSAGAAVARHRRRVVRCATRHLFLVAPRSRRCARFNPRSSVPRSTWTSRLQHAGPREHFPPKTRGWGTPINYYYFGYLLFANLARLSGIAPAVAYNLSLATIAASAASTAGRSARA